MHLVPDLMGHYGVLSFGFVLGRLGFDPKLNAISVGAASFCREVKADHLVVGILADIMPPISPPMPPIIPPMPYHAAHVAHTHTAAASMLPIPRPCHPCRPCHQPYFHYRPLHCCLGRATGYCCRPVLRSHPPDWLRQRCLSAGACPVSGISGCRRMSLISCSITGGQLSEMYSLRCVSSTFQSLLKHRSAAIVFTRTKGI